MPEHEKHGALRLEARGRKRVGRFHQADKVALVVDCAAAIDIAVNYLASEGRASPVGFGAHVDGHDILMGHKQDRFQRWVAALPRVEKR